MRRFSAIAVASVILVAAANWASATFTPTLVLGGSKLNQIQPIANSGYLSWDQNSPAHPNHYDDFSASLPLQNSSPVKVNRPNTQGFTGGITGDTDVSIYQEAANGTSNLFMYNLSTNLRTDPPPGINTNLWEWAPSISLGYIEFGRLNPARPNSLSKVLLYNRSTDAIVPIGSAPRSCYCISPYQVTDQYATWLVCKALCRVWYYDIAGATAYELPDPSGLDQYDPSIDGATGALYFVQAHGSWCGTHVKLLRWTIGTPISSAVTVSAIPAGHDIGASTYVSVDPGGHDNVYFDRVTCSGPQYADIYEVAAADTTRPTQAWLGSSAAPQDAATISRLRAGAI